LPRQEIHPEDPMSKKLDKNTANLERLAEAKIHAIRRIVLADADQNSPAVNDSGIRSREIETVVFESLQVRKALRRFRRQQARRLKNARADR